MRIEPRTHPQLPATPVATELVAVYDASAGQLQPARADDPVARAALRVADAQARWFAERFGHAGVDGAGTPFRIAVNVQGPTGFYSSDNGVVYGSDVAGSLWKAQNGDPEFFKHEFTHAILDTLAPSALGGDWRTIHEAWGMLIQNGDDDDWLVNEDMLVDGTPHRTSVPYALDRPEDFGAQGRDMERRLSTAHAGVRAAEAIGRDAMIDVWFHAMVNRLEPTMQVPDASAATVASARELHGEPAAQAVHDAWRAVGITPAAGTPG